MLYCGCGRAAKPGKWCPGRSSGQRRSVVILFFKKNHKYMSKAIDPATLSSTVSPGEDFYQFVNGSWAERTEIPSDRGRWGSFDELRKLTNERSLALL